MKKISIILLIMLISLAVVIPIVNAVETAVTLKINKTEINPGDTFIVTVSGSCEEGINGLIGNLTYDKEHLEVVSAVVADNNWSNIGQNSEGNVEMAIVSNGIEAKTADIFKVTFKLKDSVASGTTVKVTAKDIVLDSFEETNSEKNITNVNEISFNVKEVTAAPENTQSNEVQKPANTQNNTYKEIANKNSTLASGKMPYTGTSIFTGLAVITIVTIIIASYISYRRYKNV